MTLLGRIFKKNNAQKWIFFSSLVLNSPYLPVRIGAWSPGKRSQKDWWPNTSINMFLTKYQKNSGCSMDVVDTRLVFVRMFCDVLWWPCMTETSGARELQGPPLAAAITWILQPVQGRISTAIRPIIRRNPRTDTIRPHIEVYPHRLGNLLFFKLNYSVQLVIL